MSDKDFTCQKCGRRLPVVRLQGAATIICRYCKERTAIEVKPTPSFRESVAMKA